MILRKPYAFLIKYFRIIHIILTFLCIYILNQTGDIYNFFDTYIENGYTAIITDNFSNSFISINLYIAIIISIAIMIFISYLFVYKKKSYKIYAISILYFVLLFIFFIIYNSIFSEMQFELIGADNARIYRDVSLIFYLPQYVTLIFFAIRALGFNVKQFNFKDELHKLNAGEDDREEVELNIEFNAYRTKRSFRRFIREMRYYIRENLFFFIIVSVSLVFTFSYNIISNFSIFTNNYYKVNQSFYYDKFLFNVKDSVISNTDQGGNVIADDYYFLVLSLEISNQSLFDYKFDVNNIKLFYDNKFVSPTNEYSNLFSDYGDSYIYDYIKNDTSRVYAITYKIPKDKIKNKFEVKLFFDTYVSGGVTYPLYNIVKLNPAILVNKVDAMDVKLKDVLDFTNSNIKSSNIVINDYKVANVHYYDEEKCIKDVCNTITNTVYVPYSSSSQLNTILKIDANLELDKSTLYYQNNKSDELFFENFVKVQYVMDGKLVVSSVEVMKTTEDSFYLLVPKKVLDSKRLNLVIDIRNKEYVYKLL